MSIRNYRPKPDSRRTITPWRNFTLVAVLTVALALQLSYPLIEGERLRLVTIATVYWAAGAMLLHALFAYGFTYAIRFLLITFTYALLVEQIGMRTTWPFGSYEYSPTLGYQIFGVPLVVPFAWIMMPTQYLSQREELLQTLSLLSVGMALWPGIYFLIRRWFRLEDGVGR
ncbi:MAG: carotenoid biosynthesis protein [Actinomycetota bacterium]